VSFAEDRPHGARPSDRPLPPHLDPRTLHPRQPPPGSRRAAAAGQSRASRMLSVLAVLTSFAVLAVSMGGYALVHHYDDQIERVDDVFAIDEADRPEAASRDARNLLLVGSDSRGDLAAGEGVQGRGEEFVTGPRSDTIILAHLYGDADQAQLVSFPRDAWVTIPAYRDPETGDLVEEHQGKLNSAFQNGGPPLLIRTIEQLSGLRIDNYAQIDFDGFQAMVDTLGGVEVCLSEPAQDPFSGIDLPAGRQTIAGEQALAFVRQRKGLPNGDLGRIARQQQFIGAIVRKTLSAGTLLNPFRLNDVIEVATQSLQVDEELSIDDMRDLALRFGRFDANGVSFTTLPVNDVSASRGGQSVVLLDEAAMDDLFEQLRRDIPPSAPEVPAEEPSEPLIVAPENVRVQVFNGAGIAGLGRRASDDLAAVGFTMVGAPDNRGTEARQTTVYHGPDKADSARTLSAAIPGSRTELDASLTDTLEVVVGSSYDGAQPVRVGGAAAPPPTAPSSEEPPVTTAAEDPCAR
jgi:LCP family protein required for cell wall assembly